MGHWKSNGESDRENYLMEDLLVSTPRTGVTEGSPLPTKGGFDGGEKGVVGDAAW